VYGLHLDDPTLEWIAIPQKGANWPAARFGHGQVYAENRVILFGGNVTDSWEIVIPAYCNKHQDCDSCVVEGCGWCMTNLTTRAGQCYPGNANGPFISDTCLDLLDQKAWLLLGECIPPPLTKFLLPTLIVTAGATLIVVIGVVLWTKKMIEEENYITVN